jgi:hypothetical protein
MLQYRADQAVRGHGRWLHLVIASVMSLVKGSLTRREARLPLHQDGRAYRAAPAMNAATM